MEGLLSADRLRALWDTVYGWLLTNVLVLDNAVQVVVVGLTLLLAMLFAKRFKPWLARYRDHRAWGAASRSPSRWRCPSSGSA